MRLFVAIGLPPELQRHLAELRIELPGARWVRPEQLHLTLAFLGEVGEERLEPLCRELAAVSFVPFRLVFDRLGCFPHPRSPRVIWIGVSSCPPLERLATKVRVAVVAGGMALEERSFTAHVTLARLREPAPAAAVDSFLRQSLQQRLQETTVTEFLLMQSLLSRQGAVHQVLRRFTGTV